MPIAFPPADVGPAYAPDDDVQAFTSGYDISNLGLVGADFGRDSLNPGLAIFGDVGIAPNMRNPGFSYEAVDTGFRPNPAPAPLMNDGAYVLQFDTAASNAQITGVTRDSAGVVLASCSLDLFATGSDQVVASTVSGADGSFTFGNPGTGPFYLVAYKAGSPDVAGTTVNTIMPALVVPPVAAPSISTMLFSSAQAQAAQVGAINTVSNAARVYGRSTGETIYMFRVSGSSAVFHGWSDFGDDGTLLSVSVDGAAFSNVPASSGDLHTLFTGLADTIHTVLVKWGSAYGSSPYILSSGTVLEVTGAPPSFSPPTVWLDPITSSNVAGASFKVADYTNYSPAFLPGGVSSQSKPSIRFTSSTSFLDIVSGARFVFVSINGASPTRYDLGGSTGVFLPRYLRVPVSGTNGYNVWCDNGPSVGNYNLMYVGVDSAPTTTSAGRLEQFGDSITYGEGSSNVGEVDVYRVAAQYGYAGQAFGISGQTVAGLSGIISSQLAAKVSVPANDVGIIAIGRNNTGTWDSTTISDYTAIITAMLPYYKKILCRGVMREGATIWSTFNNGLSALVTSLANPKVVYINADAWTGITTSDGIHPTDAGYTTVAGYAATAYAPYL